MNQSVLGARELREYPASLVKALFDMSDKKKPTGLAAAISKSVEAINSDLRSDERELLIPLDALLSTRGLTASTQSTGGFLVGQDISQQIEAVLRPASCCIRAGAQVLTGLGGNQNISREISEVTVSWLAERDPVTESNGGFGSIAFTPHRLAGLTSLTKQLQIQGTPNVSNFVIESLAKGIGVAFDKAALRGSGIFGEPTGIYSTPNVKTVTFGGAATWANVLKFESQISQANGDDESIAFVGAPAVREKWRATQRFSGASDTLWNSDEDMVGSKPAFVSQNLTSTQVCAGDFSKMLFATWGQNSPISVIVDPYAQKRAEKIEIQVTLYGDVGLLREQVFCINADSAVQ